MRLPFLKQSLSRRDYKPILKITNFRGVNRIMTEIFPNIFSVIGQGEMDDLKSIAELKSLEKLEKSLKIVGVFLIPLRFRKVRSV